VLTNGDELELKRMYETLNLYDDNCDVSDWLTDPVVICRNRINEVHSLL